MKKILHMTPIDVNSGVYKYIFNHYQYFDLKNISFGFLTRAADMLARTDEYKKYGFTIHPFSTTQRQNAELLRREILKVLEQYDVIHLHTSSWRGFLIEELAMDVGMEKVIVHSHSTGIDVQNEQERLKQQIEHEKYRELFNEKYATDLCACSKKAGEWLFGDAIQVDKIKILPNAIDTEKYRFSDETRSKVRTELNLKADFVIGHVGRYSYTKNQIFLIQLVADLQRQIPNIKLICIGEGENKETLKNEINKLSLQTRVKLVDWVDNIQDYLQAIDIFCLPSFFEGFPISVVEAQAAGLPCIVSENITDEIMLTEYVRKAPLLKEKWVSEIVEIYENQNIDRNKYFNMLLQKGYDVKKSAEILTKLWLD